MLSTGKKIFAGLGITAVVLIAAVSVFKTEAPISEDAPPSIDLQISGSSKFSGSINNNCIPNGHGFTAAEEANFTAPVGGTEGVLQAGVHIYHADNDITVQHILDSVQPDDQNRILVVAYNPINNRDKKFAIYPTINSNLVLPVQNPREYVIPSNNGFIIASCKEVKMWNMKSEAQAGSGLPSNIQDVDDNWILFSANLDPNLNLNPYNITSAYPQIAAGPVFPATGVNLNQVTIGNPYYMVWMKISPRGDDAPACPGGVVRDNNGICQEPEEEVPLVVPDFQVTFNGMRARMSYRFAGSNVENMPALRWCADFNGTRGNDADASDTTICHPKAEIAGRSGAFEYTYERGGEYVVTLTAYDLQNRPHTKHVTVQVAAAEQEAVAVNCQDIGLTIRDSNNREVQETARNRFYTLSATPILAENSAQPEVNTIEYQIDIEYGTFITSFQSADRIKNQFNRFQVVLTREAILASLNLIGTRENVLSQSVTKDAGVNTYLVTYSNAPSGEVQNAIRVVTTGSFENQCRENHGIPAAAVPAAPAPAAPAPAPAAQPAAAAPAPAPVAQPAAQPVDPNRLLDKYLDRDVEDYAEDRGDYDINWGPDGQQYQAAPEAPADQMPGERILLQYQ